MKRLLALLLLAGLSYGGYLFYQQHQLNNTSFPVSNLSVPQDLVLQEPSGAWDNIQSVLGASISNAVETSKEWVSDATDGRSDPIINRAITNFQEELKDLPQEQVERIKYDFCKPIVDEYEKN